MSFEATEGPWKRKNLNLDISKDPVQYEAVDLFLTAKMDIERHVNEGKNHHFITKSLEARPYRIGDHVIENFMAYELWQQTEEFKQREQDKVRVIKDEMLDEETTADDIKAQSLIPATNYFKLYLGCEDLVYYKKEGRVIHLTDLLRVRRRGLNKTDRANISYALDILKDLNRIRSFAFKNHYLLDVEVRERQSGFEGLSFNAHIIDYESDTYMGFLTSRGYQAGDAYLFEKIGREIFGFKAEELE